jgi:MFS transporter, DHA1 family, multidrug resistance protein
MYTSGIKHLLLIFVIFIAACIETDIYLPAFPDMMAYFKTTEEEIQRLLTWNFAGICLSGPLYGPLSDSFGRKKPLLVALGLFLAGSLLTMFAESFSQMLIGRLLQGLGSGGCFTLGTAILFDVFRAEKAIKALNQLNLTIPFIMAFAPMLGGALNHLFGFRSNFLAIGLFVLLSLAVCLFYFEESLEKEKRSPFQARKILRDFKEAFTCLPFWQLTVIMSFMFAGYLAFLSSTSVLFVVEFGMSKKVFPFFQAAILGAWLIGSLTCMRAIARFGIQRLKQVGTALIVIGGIGLAASALLAPVNPYFSTGAMLLYTFGCNWTISFYFPEGMELLPHIKGVTASLMTSARLLFAALIVGLGGYFYDGTIFPIVWIILGILALIVPTIFFYERWRKASPLAAQAEIQTHGPNHP